MLYTKQVFISTNAMLHDQKEQEMVSQKAVTNKKVIYLGTSNVVQAFNVIK